MEKSKEVITLYGWKPNDYSTFVINLQLNDAEKVIYAEEYKCHPHYRLYLQYYSEKHLVEVSDKEFTSPNLFEIIFDKFEQLDPRFSRSIDLDESKMGDIVRQFRHDIKKLAGSRPLVSTSFSGGLEYDRRLGQWFYYPPLTYRMRTALKANSNAFGNLRELRPAPFLPSSARNILGIFIIDLRTSLILKRDCLYFSIFTMHILLAYSPTSSAPKFFAFTPKIKALARKSFLPCSPVQNMIVARSCKKAYQRHSFCSDLKKRRISLF